MPGKVTRGTAELVLAGPGTPTLRLAAGDALGTAPQPAGLAQPPLARPCQASALGSLGQGSSSCTRLTGLGECLQGHRSNALHKNCNE